MKHNRRTTRSTGFTLVEIMLAMGVLGIGMIMVAAIFPAAIYQTREADRNTRATLISDNARAIIRLKERHDIDPGLPIVHPYGPLFSEVPLGNTAPGGWTFYRIYDSDAWYPTPIRIPFEDEALAHGVANADLWPPDHDDHDDPDDPYAYRNNTHGWVALGRQVMADANDYQFVVIAYEKFTGVDYSFDTTKATTVGTWGIDYRPALVRAAAGVPDMDHVEVIQDATGCRVLFNRSDFLDLDFVALGSPVILDGADPADPVVLGRYPTIVGLEDDGTHLIAYLSANLLLDSAMVLPPVYRGIWLMRGVSEGADSPAIGTMSFRTVLP